MFKKSISTTGLRWLWVTLLVFGLDQCTKFLVVQNFNAYDPLYINSFFNLMLAYNKGAAFSFLANQPGWQSWILGGLALVVSVVIVMHLKKMSAQQRWLGVALSLIIGGALGNLYDRVTLGHVIDFIQLHISHYYWPVFNVADSAICVGATMLFIEILFRKK